MTFLTIKNGNTEKTLEDWKLDNLKRSRANLSVGTVSFMALGRAVDASDLFTYGSTVEVWKDRVSVDGETFSGGSRWFYGRVESWDRVGDGRSENCLGKLVDPMWYLANCIFRHSYQSFVRWTDPAKAGVNPVYETVTNSRVFLNQAYPNGKLTTGQQIREIIQWAIDRGAPIQIGNITPDLDVAIDEVKNITCLEGLRKMWRWSPDAVFWFDYSTTPYPTLHCKRASELIAVNVDLNAGKPLDRIRIRPRPDWQKSYVLITYEKSVNGLNQIIKDQYPAEIPEGGNFNGFETTIDLAGSQIQTTTATVRTYPIDVTTADWWKLHIASLTHARVATVVISEGKIESREKNDAGETIPYDAALTNELLTNSAALADWMNVSAQRVRASATVALTFNDGTAPKSYPIWVDVHATNAITKPYTSTDFDEPGDPVPVGLARKMYDAFAAMTAEGSITNLDQELPENIGMENVLNFLTPEQPTWATLRVIVQGIEDDVASGICSINFGAPEHLPAGDLVELLRVARMRNITSSYSMRKGSAAKNSSVSLGNKTPEQNSQTANFDDGSGVPVWA